MEASQRVLTCKTCPLCGRDLPEQKRTGRPRVFCGSECRKLYQMLGWLEDQLAAINPTPEKKKNLRRRLWFAANLLNSKI
jgi:endogenous inhibitor of DNA gyrase (YacG/DUF329 family)